jgi:hypothetical protein
VLSIGLSGPAAQRETPTERQAPALSIGDPQAIASVPNEQERFASASPITE